MPPSSAMDSQQLVQAGLFFPDHHFCRFDDRRHLVSWLQFHVFGRMPGNGGDQLLTVTQFDNHFGHHRPQRDRFHTASQLIAGTDLHRCPLLSLQAVDGFRGQAFACPPAYDRTFLAALAHLEEWVWMPMNGGSMHTAREKEALLLQIACLEGQVQQITKDWEQLGQWEETDQRLLTAVQEHTEQVQALLDRSGSCDQQIRNALSELLVIGHVQQVLLEQTMQREANERRRMAAEALEIVQAARHEQEPPDHP